MALVLTPLKGVSKQDCMASTEGKSTKRLYRDIRLVVKQWCKTSASRPECFLAIRKTDSRGAKEHLRDHSNYVETPSKLAQ